MFETRKPATCSQSAARLAKDADWGRPVAGMYVRNECYVCPVCLAPIVTSHEGLKCIACELSFRLIDGIPIFADHADSRYGTMSRSDLAELLRLCQERGWETGVASFLGTKSLRGGDFWARYFLPEARAAGRLLLPANPSAKVLDLGCGIGPLSINFARYVNEVFALDCGLAQLQLLRLRAEQARIANLRLVCAGDRQHLPFPAGTFDVVLLNGILEWVGTRGGGNPRQRQRNFLAEVHRVLKSGGEVYIGIENRFAFTYLLGRADEHTNLRFVTLLPRKIANLLSVMKSGQPYRVYTYTRWGYRKLLREAGFRGTHFYLPRSNYREMNQIVEGENSSVSADSFCEKPCLREMKRRRLKALAYPYLAHSYSILAGKTQLAPGLIDEAVVKLEAWLAAESSGTSKLQPVLIRIGQTSVALVSVAEKQGARRFMLRIPLTPQVAHQQRHNLQTLNKLVVRLAPDCPIRDLLPEPVVTLDCQGQPVFVERHCPGFDLRHSYRPEDQPAIFRLGLDFLVQLNRELDEHGPHAVSAIAAWLRKREEHVYRTAAAFPQGSLQALIEDAIACFRHEPLAAVCTHGDFWPGNLLSTARGDRLTGVVDWEFADPEGMPLLDLLQLLLVTKGLSSGKGFTRLLVERLSTRRFEEDERPFVEEYCCQLGISTRSIWPLVFMAWLDWVYRRTSVHGYLPSWRHNEINGFMEATGKLNRSTV